VTRRALVFIIFASAPAAAGEKGGLAGGIDRFREGNYAGAVQALEPWRTSHPDDADVKLLLGISYYHLGQKSRARDLLAEAAGGSEEETANAARAFLGLIAAEGGDLDRAANLLRAAASASSPELAQIGQALLAEHVPGRLHILAMAGSGYDSNVARLPASLLRMPATSAGDGNASVQVALTARPWRRFGLTLEETAVYRQQLRLTAFDWFGNMAGAGYSVDFGQTRAMLGYGFEVMTLGESLYALGHAAQAGLMHGFGATGARAGIQYELRDRSYRLSDYSTYSGITHQGAAALGWRSPDGVFDLSARGFLGQELTRAPELRDLWWGGQFALRLGLVDGLDVRGSGTALWKSFDEGGRADRLLIGDASISYQLASHWAVMASTTAMRNFSTNLDFAYKKITASLDVRVDWTGY